MTASELMMGEGGVGPSCPLPSMLLLITQPTSVLSVHHLRLLEVLPPTPIAWQRASSMTSRTVLVFAHSCVSSPSGGQHMSRALWYYLLRRGRKRGRKEHHLSASQHLPCQYFWVGSITSWLKLLPQLPCGPLPSADSALPVHFHTTARLSFVKGDSEYVTFCVKPQLPPVSLRIHGSPLSHLARPHPATLLLADHAPATPSCSCCLTPATLPLASVPL